METGNVLYKKWKHPNTTAFCVHSESEVHFHGQHRRPNIARARKTDNTYILKRNYMRLNHPLKHDRTVSLDSGRWLCSMIMTHQTILIMMENHMQDEIWSIVPQLKDILRAEIRGGKRSNSKKKKKNMSNSKQSNGWFNQTDFLNSEP